MNKLIVPAILLATLAALLAFGNEGLATDRRHPVCSVEKLAGRWLFATEVGQFPAFGGDITALGTLNIHRNGDIDGNFDATVALVGFLPGNTYGGSVVVNPDCTGTLSFVNSQGIERTDSIAVVSKNEIWGMSQDPGNLWTYEARKISPSPRR